MRINEIGYLTYGTLLFSWIVSALSVDRHPRPFQKTTDRTFGRNRTLNQMLQNNSFVFQNVEQPGSVLEQGRIGEKERTARSGVFPVILSSVPVYLSDPFSPVQTSFPATEGNSPSGQSSWSYQQPANVSVEGPKQFLSNHQTTSGKNRPPQNTQTNSLQAEIPPQLPIPPPKTYIPPGPGYEFQSLEEATFQGSSRKGKHYHPSPRPPAPPTGARPQPPAPPDLRPPTGSSNQWIREPLPPAPPVAGTETPNSIYGSRPLPPAPPPITGSSVQVSGIYCIRTGSFELFRADIQLPKSSASEPTFEGVTTHDAWLSGSCKISRVNRNGLPAYQLELFNMAQCGVTECNNQEEKWLCLTMRVPLLPHLKLLEDDLVTIKCKPQERKAEHVKTLSFSPVVYNRERQRPRVAVGGSQGFESDIGLYWKQPGTSDYTNRIFSGDAVHIGEQLELRSTVRNGYGWRYSRLTDVGVHRRRTGYHGNRPQDSVILVDSEGCRNPEMKIVCPDHPRQEPGNALSNALNFQAFTFDGMSSGDEVLVSVRLVACVEAADCPLTFCQDDGSYRKRRKRDLGQSNYTFADNRTVGWESELSLKILLDEAGKQEISQGAEHQNNCTFNYYLPSALAAVLCITNCIFIFCCIVQKHRSTRRSAKLFQS